MIYYRPSIDLINNHLKKELDKTANVFKNKLMDASFSDVVGELTGFDLIKTDLKCGGYCDIENKEIAHVSGGINTILHEISHVIQHKHELLEHKKKLSENLVIEQQAETMAKYLYMKIYDKTDVFDAYFTKDSILFLSDWYKDNCEQDIPKEVLAKFPNWEHF